MFFYLRFKIGIVILGFIFSISTPIIPLALADFPNGSSCFAFPLSVYSPTAFNSLSDKDATNPTLSSDGMKIAFQSNSTNLLPPPMSDTNSKSDIYLWDGLTFSLKIISVSSNNGAQANEDSFAPSISSDGRFIAFESQATNLDVNAQPGIFIYDDLTLTTSWIATGNYPSLSDNGNRVGFKLDGWHSPGMVLDRTTNILRQVTPGNVYHYKLSGDGKTAVYYSTQPSTGVYIVDLEQFPFISTPILIAGGFSDGGVSISSDGELIAFSTSSALVADDINGHYDVYTWTRSTGIFERVTAFEFDPAPSQMGNYSSHFVTENNGSTFSPQLSRNGRFLALQSVSDHFTPFDFPLDTGDYRDVFVIDLHSKLVHRSTRSETWQNYFSGIDDDGDKYSKTELTIGPIVSDDGSRVVFYSDLNQPFAGLSGNGKNQIYVDQCPTFSASSYPIRCAGDGLLGACPMGNNGAKNRGCAHSVNAKGAKLEAWGMASVSNPAVFKLVVSGLPDSSTVALFEMNGSVNQNGISWGGGDGLRCVGFQAQTKIVVPGVTNQTLHFGYGQTFNPHLNLSALPFSTKTYQVKYRDKAANFGTTSTFNWTNAIEVLWLP